MRLIAAKYNVPSLIPSYRHNSSTQRQENTVHHPVTKAGSVLTSGSVGYLFLGLLLEAGEAILEGLAVLIRGVFGETV